MVNQPNTIYEIRYDFDLDGQTIEVPENCTLKFEGGSLGNGVIKSNDLYIEAGPYYILKNIIFEGGHIINNFNALWFGLRRDSFVNKTFDDVTINTDNSILIESAIKSLRNYEGYSFFFPIGTYYFSREIVFIANFSNAYGKNKGSNLTILGAGKGNTLLVFGSDNGISFKSTNPYAIQGFINVKDLTLINYKDGIYNPLEKYNPSSDLSTFENKGYAIYRKGSYTSTISNISIYGFYSGIYIYEQYGGVIIDRVFSNYLIYGIVVESNCNNVKLNNCYFNGFDVSYYLKSSYGIVDQCLTELDIPEEYEGKMRSIGFYVERGNWIMNQAYTEARYVSRYFVDAVVCDNNPICVQNHYDKLSENVKNKINSKEIIYAAYYIIANAFYITKYKANIKVNELDFTSGLYSTNKEYFANINIVENNSKLNSIYVNNEKKILAECVEFNFIQGTGNVTLDCFLKGNAIPLINSIKDYNSSDNSISNINPINVVPNNGFYGFMNNKSFSRQICKFVSIVNNKETPDGLELITDSNGIVYYNNVSSKKTIFYVTSTSIKYGIPVIPPNKSDLQGNQSGYELLAMDNNNLGIVKTTNGNFFPILCISSSIYLGSTNTVYKDNTSKKMYLFFDDYYYDANGIKYGTNYSGLTEKRPKIDLVGFCYFDTTINKPIWWNGSKWVDATGAEV